MAPRKTPGTKFRKEGTKGEQDLVEMDTPQLPEPVPSPDEEVHGAKSICTWFVSIAGYIQVECLSYQGVGNVKDRALRQGDTNASLTG